MAGGWDSAGGASGARTVGTRGRPGQISQSSADVAPVSSARSDAPPLGAPAPLTTRAYGHSPRAVSEVAPVSSARSDTPSLGAPAPPDHSRLRALATCGVRRGPWSIACRKPRPRRLSTAMPGLDGPGFILGSASGPGRWERKGGASERAEETGATSAEPCDAWPGRPRVPTVRALLAPPWSSRRPWPRAHCSASAALELSPSLATSAMRCLACYFAAISRSKRGFPLSGAKVGSIRSQPGER